MEFSRAEIRAFYSVFTCRSSAFALVGARLFIVLCVLRLNARQNRLTPVTRPWLAEFEWQQMSAAEESCGAGAVLLSRVNGGEIY